jgi:hypothetical protein
MAGSNRREVGRGLRHRVQVYNRLGGCTIFAKSLKIIPHSLIARAAQFPSMGEDWARSGLAATGRRTPVGWDRCPVPPARDNGPKLRLGEFSSAARLENPLEIEDP